MNFDFSADRLISMGIILLKAIIILAAGHYITLFLIKLMKKSLKKLSIDISLEKFFEKVGQKACYLRWKSVCLQQEGLF